MSLYTKSFNISVSDHDIVTTTAVQKQGELQNLNLFRTQKQLELDRLTPDLADCRAY